MKWQRSLLAILFVSSILVACSDNGNDDPAPSTQAANTTTATTIAPSTEVLKSDAKEKRTDVAAKKLKDKVQMMTETVHAGENTGKYSLKQVFKYDKNGNQLELSEYNGDGSLNSTIKSIYDSSGKLVSDETVLSTGELAIKSVIKTDEKGNKVEEAINQLNLKNILANTKYLYKYDEKAHVIERLGLRGNGGFFLKYNFNYDANGNLAEWLILSDKNEIIEKRVFKYDNNNNITEETRYNRDGSVKDAFTFSYDVDKKGNWTRMKKIKDGSVIEVRKREYKYY
jgi:hypothetical protein